MGKLQRTAGKLYLALINIKFLKQNQSQERQRTPLNIKRNQFKKKCIRIINIRYQNYKYTGTQHWNP